MRGSTNVIIPNYTPSNTLRYSYDGVIWRKFDSQGIDEGQCASIDLANNIISIKVSGYDMVTNTQLTNTDGAFYLKFERNCNISYCLVGGGGGGGARGAAVNQATRGGHGGAGGMVLYTVSPEGMARGNILKIQIGEGGAGGGNSWFYSGPNPQPGHPSMIYSYNQATGEETILAQASGGNAATASAIGAGVAATTSGNHYHKSSAGGTGTTTTQGGNGADGTKWAINDTYYGGGGGGAGRFNDNGVGAGGSGGAGGGGHGNTTITDATANTGGGGGGNNTGNGAGSAGGSGICLIKFG